MILSAALVLFLWAPPSSSSSSSYSISKYIQTHVDGTFTPLETLPGYSLLECVTLCEHRITCTIVQYDPLESLCQSLDRDGLGWLESGGSKVHIHEDFPRKNWGQIFLRRWYRRSCPGCLKNALQFSTS